MPDNCLFCHKPVAQGATYVRVLVGVEGQGELGINIKVCMNCVLTRGSSLLEYIPKAVGLLSGLGFKFGGAAPAGGGAGEPPPGQAR